MYQPPDQMGSGSRFRVQQYLVATGNTENVMASFVQNTVANAQADSSAASFYIFCSGGEAGGNGTATVRALECQATRASPATSNITRSLEVGLHSQIAGNQSNFNVGLYVNSAHTGWLASGVRNDTGVYITGQDGWYNALLYMDETDSVVRFKVGQSGDVYASQGNFQVDSSGNVKTNGTLAAVNAATGTALFTVDSGGNATATSFTPTSSRLLKQDVSRPWTADRAAELLDSLEPVRFRYKHQPEREHMGFILEDTPQGTRPDGKGRVSIMDLIAVLTHVWPRSKARRLDRERKRTLSLRQRLDEIRDKRAQWPGGRCRTYSERRRKA